MAATAMARLCLHSPASADHAGKRTRDGSGHHVVSSLMSRIPNGD